MESNLVSIICGLVALAVVFIGCIVTLIILNKKQKKDRQVDDVKIVEGTRMTKDGIAITENGNVKISLQKGDILLERGKEYICKRGTDIIPGKYTVLSCDENNKTFNLRIGGIVREYSHFSSIVLLENDKISAVSHPVILR